MKKVTQQFKYSSGIESCTEPITALQLLVAQVLRRKQ